MNEGLNLLASLISSHEHVRDQISRYLFVLTQDTSADDASFPFRVWRKGRYETKPEAIERAKRQLALEDETLAAYRDAMERALS